MTSQNIPQGQDNNTHHALICTRCSLLLDHDVETLPDIFLELAHVNALGPLGVVNKFRPYTTRLARRCREQVLLTRVLLRQATALSIVSAVVVETGWKVVIVEELRIERRRMVVRCISNVSGQPQRKGEMVLTIVISVDVTTCCLVGGGLSPKVLVDLAVILVHA